MKFKSPYADLFEEKKTDRYRFELSIDRFADKDIIKKLESVPNKSDYIRKLVRADIRKTKKGS